MVVITPKDCGNQLREDFDSFASHSFAKSSAMNLRKTRSRETHKAMRVLFLKSLSKMPLQTDTRNSVFIQSRRLLRKTCLLLCTPKNVTLALNLIINPSMKANSLLKNRKEIPTTSPDPSRTWEKEFFFQRRVEKRS